MWGCVICMKMEATGDHHPDQNKPHTNTHVFLSYVESISRVYMCVHMRHLRYRYESRKGSKKSNVEERKEAVVENKHDQGTQYTSMKTCMYTVNICIIQWIPLLCKTNTMCLQLLHEVSGTCYTTVQFHGTSSWLISHATVGKPQKPCWQWERWDCYPGTDLMIKSAHM